MQQTDVDMSYLSFNWNFLCCKIHIFYLMLVLPKLSNKRSANDVWKVSLSGYGCSAESVCFPLSRHGAWLARVLDFFFPAIAVTQARRQGSIFHRNFQCHSNGSPVKPLFNRYGLSANSALGWSTTIGPETRYSWNIAEYCKENVNEKNKTTTNEKSGLPWIIG